MPFDSTAAGHAMFVLPQGYELIKKGRVTIALHERYRDCLLGQGIADPE